MKIVVARDAVALAGYCLRLRHCCCENYRSGDDLIFRSKVMAIVEFLHSKLAN
jgi:hypothetical protein